MTLGILAVAIGFLIVGEEVRLKPDTTTAREEVRLKPDTTTGREGALLPAGRSDLRGSRRVNLQADAAGQDRATTMEGCIAKRTSTQQALTFQDAASGFRYRITGRNLGRYAGQRVEIIGATPRPRRLAVRGGLWPSPNVAGQAGAMDPARAAIAAQPGGPESGTGGVELLPEFRVTRVRAVQGACE